MTFSFQTCVWVSPIKRSTCCVDKKYIFFSVLGKGLYQTESYSLHVLGVNTHLNHRRIFLFSTPCGVESLLCMRNINCKPHWLTICCLSRIFYFLGILRFKSIHLLFYTFIHIIHMYISNDSNVILKYFHFVLLVVFF